jgi:protein arginine kinase activator
MGLLEDDRPDITPPDAACDECGMTFADFRRTGRLGCGACYDRFAVELAPLLRRIHGSETHLGRTPAEFEARFARREELRRLKADLRRAVFREEYERAAELRDAIRSIRRAAGGGDDDADA